MLASPPRGIARSWAGDCRQNPGSLVPPAKGASVLTSPVPMPTSGARGAPTKPRSACLLGRIGAQQKGGNESREILRPSGAPTGLLAQRLLASEGVIGRRDTAGLPDRSCYLRGSDCGTPFEEINRGKKKLILLALSLRRSDCGADGPSDEPGIHGIAATKGFEVAISCLWVR